MARQSLDDIISQLREHYDYILIDTAPVGLVSDTLQVSRIANATVYLCRADYTPKSSFELINSLNKEKKMPKMKTHRAAAKRYKVTATGKIMKRQAGIGHLLQHKSASRKRRIFKMVGVSESHVALVSKELPYKKYSR